MSLADSFKTALYNIQTGLDITHFLPVAAATAAGNAVGVSPKVSQSVAQAATGQPISSERVTDVLPTISLPDFTVPIFDWSGLNPVETATGKVQTTNWLILGSIAALAGYMVAKRI